MGWSTTEVARLAEVSVRAVRYYHEVGLLPMPERKSNGYKSYGAAHLVRLLQIRRLTALGFTLAQIKEIDSDGRVAEELFDSLDAEIADRIEQLQRIRRELKAVLVDEVRGGVPPGFRVPESGVVLTESDKTALSVMNQLLPEERREGLKEWLSTPGSHAGSDADPDPDADFEALPEDADEATREALAVRMLPAARVARRRSPSASTPPDTARDIGKALRDIYNRAQIDVLIRVATALES
ncbi:MerR family transcriptional regulator [Tsukamurella sp. 8F]|uniref:MerR family transcriptional regulator n=1 Tax=unclassified Tsukamurella TaxID=2633480 RepID=UPI0023BA0472|nr:MULTISPECIES: MerR family transcriptional regulator [unclassified Tsukamurella]MDF0528869.1 MerR family transcriptional regulator [Tsukamurella sp. 8J]MDF0586704.1 MerR family transcriptional regulator [Tsukamurella sp. 8F]